MTGARAGQPATHMTSQQ